MRQRWLPSAPEYSSGSETFTRPSHMKPSRNSLVRKEILCKLDEIHLNFSGHRIVCLAEVSWMFGQLDGDSDGRLTPAELWTLEHDRYEPCLQPLIDRCDSDADQHISMDEWCDCFQYAGRGEYIRTAKESPTSFSFYFSQRRATLPQG